MSKYFSKNINVKYFHSNFYKVFLTLRTKFGRKVRSAKLLGNARFSTTKQCSLFYEVSLKRVRIVRFAEVKKVRNSSCFKVFSKFSFLHFSQKLHFSRKKLPISKESHSAPKGKLKKPTKSHHYHRYRRRMSCSEEWYEQPRWSWERNEFRFMNIEKI